MAIVTDQAARMEATTLHSHLSLTILLHTFRLLDRPTRARRQEGAAGVGHRVPMAGTTRKVIAEAVSRRPLLMSALFFNTATMAARSAQWVS
jgi:hypothetical protein